MDEETIKSCLTTWICFARKQRCMARAQFKFYAQSESAAESMGVARGIMLMARSVKGYHTQALYVNSRRKFE